MLTRWCTITWKSPLIVIYHNLHWFNCCRFTTNLSSEYINEFQHQCFKLCLELSRSLEGNLRHQLFGSLNYFVNGVHVERIIFPINVIIIRNGIEDVFLPDELIVCEHAVLKGVPTLRSVGTPIKEHKVLS